MPTNTQDTEAPHDADTYAEQFDAQELDIFGGTGTRGEEVELDEKALSEQAERDEKAAKKAAKAAKKRKSSRLG